MGQIYEQLQIVSSETETNDCAVIALALVTGRPRTFAGLGLDLVDPFQ